MENLSEFWSQLSLCFGEEYQGLSEEQVLTKEKKLGISFPKTYRQLMKLQNGGYIRKPSYFDGTYTHFLFCNGFESISFDNDSCDTFRDLLFNMMSNEEIDQAVADTPGSCYPERLVLFSDLDGHSFAAFDYGWNSESIYKEPKVVIFREDPKNNLLYTQTLEITNFDKLLEGLVYWGPECATSIGLVTNDGIEKLGEKLSTYGDDIVIDQDSLTSIDEDNINITGKINLNNKWYSIKITPNQYRSGIWAFQAHQDIPYILEINTNLTEDQPMQDDVHNFIYSLTAKTGIKASLLIMPKLLGKPCSCC